MLLLDAALLEAMDEPSYLIPPPNFAFLRLSGETWCVQGRDFADFRKLNKLICNGLFDTDGAGFDKPPMEYVADFMITDKTGNQVITHSISELTEKVDWSNPVATVVLSEGFLNGVRCPWLRSYINRGMSLWIIILN